MMVKNGDMIFRDERMLEVICADAKVFVLAPVVDGLTVFDNLEAYSNDASIMSLDELNMHLMEQLHGVVE